MREMVEFEDVIGWALRIGVIISAILIIFGFALLIIHNGAYPYTLNQLINPKSNINTKTIGFNSIISGIMSFNGLDLIMLGLVVLIATPVLRVFIGIIQFAREKDYLYTIITIIVFFNLMFAIFIIPHIVK
ncbi:putative membrane protein [Caldisphaera lagunensis DSM 15908]|uniref:Putative membrane protein n=2 Tax=Caldisphaera lagunensis TaxID=200415 RepID=L0A8R9_CALLD|nr:putative membrane protein [Caldisphaera lagunensis DSM 15908]